MRLLWSGFSSLINCISSSRAAKPREEAYAAVGKGLEPFTKVLRRAVTTEDIQRLTELKFIRISRYDSDKADNEIRQIEEDIAQTQHHLAHLTDYTIAYYERIRDKYGKGRGAQDRTARIRTISKPRRSP